MDMGSFSIFPKDVALEEVLGYDYLYNEIVNTLMGKNVHAKDLEEYNRA